MPKVPRDFCVFSKRHQRRLVQKELETIKQNINSDPESDFFITNEEITLVEQFSPNDTPSILTSNIKNLSVVVGESTNEASLDNDEPIIIDHCDVSEEVLINSSFSEIDSESDYDNDNIDEDEDNYAIDLNDSRDPLTFREDLQIWATTCAINQAHLKELLRILRKHGHNDLPSDSRTLLKTPRNIGVLGVKPGSYYHFGLDKGLIASISDYYDSLDECPTEIKLNINVDGLPLTKSSGSQFWPILAALVADFYTEPFVVGIYHGETKPEDSNEFLKYFTEDFANLSKTGLIIGDRKFMIKINAISRDAPAKAFICGTEGHNAYFGCGKCIQEGNYVEHRVTYPETRAVLRTDDSFKLKSQEEHHKKISILESINIGMVSQLPLDYGHLICLGIMKRLLQFFTKGKRDVRIPDVQMSIASKHLVSLKKFIPHEFARKPRPLAEADRFKATEFRQFLLYTGPIVLAKTLKPDQFKHFLALSVGIRILASAEYCNILNDYAHDLLLYFVETYPLLYGHQNVSYNVHNLVHLSNDVKLFGPLDNFSTFKFENHMQRIKKMIKTSSDPLQQFIHRSMEMSESKNISMRKPIPKNPKIKYRGEEQANGRRTIKSLQHRGSLLTSQIPNNCCVLDDGRIVSISQMIQFSNDKIFLIGNNYLDVEPYFKVPCCSSKVGIYVVTEGMCSCITVAVDRIKYKCVKFELTNSQSVILPLLHN